jgi:hypothetical protein
MKVVITVENKTIIELIHQHLRSKLGEEAAPKRDDIKIKVKSKQNYRVHEWETGELQVTFEGEI